MSTVLLVVATWFVLCSAATYVWVTWWMLCDDHRTVQDDGIDAGDLDAELRRLLAAGTWE